jgi:hypothetical protein
VSKSLLILIFLGSSLISNSQEHIISRARYFEDSAWKAYQRNYFRKSITLLDSAIFYKPTNSFSYGLKAEAQWFLGDYAGAAETYRNKIALGDTNLLIVSANVFLGMLYGKAQMPEKATSQYLIAVKLWESGYVPHKQFKIVEEFDYFLALAFLQERNKALRILKERSLDSLTLPKRRELETLHEKCLLLFGRTPSELLEEHFNQYMLPKDVKPRE